MVARRLSSPIVVDGHSLTLDALERVARSDPSPSIRLGSDARRRMQRARDVVTRVIAERRTVYGINTGFGHLADVRIDGDALEVLQRNLILSHAAGVGPECNRDQVRAMILLRLNCLACGHSGARVEVAERLVALLEHDICPVVPCRGSVGASGDLAAMAHIALALIGEGKVRFRRRLTSARRALASVKLKPLVLQPKEGLALINGVQASTAILALALIDMQRLVEAQDAVCALTTLAVGGRRDAYDPRIATARPHPGQLLSTKRLNAWLRGSRTPDPASQRVQDPYSIRCAPQVHGPCRETIDQARVVCEREMNAATDNPLLFPDQGDVISGGNFHGAVIGHAADRCAAAITDAASISERRLSLLMDPCVSGASPFLTPTGGEGVNSGMMMWQVTAASVVSEMKTLSHPASIDSIPTSLYQEDHVSMSMWAARKLWDCVGLWRTVLAIEAVAAWRALLIKKQLPVRGQLKPMAEMIEAHHGRALEDALLIDVIAKVGDELDKIVRYIPRGR
ncbi:MAG: histidine ammonia-lyase [Candidatus Zixiibacteriota bacterium]